MTQPQKYIGKPVEVEAMQVSQYGDFVRARDWINETGANTTAHFQQASNDQPVDRLILVSPWGVLDVLEDSYIVLANGDFRAVSAEEFEASYSRAFDPPTQEWEGTTGTYLPRGKEGKSLLGGAALQIPK